MKGLLLINLGTPETPTKKDLRCYLKEFLSDPRVMDIHPLVRWMILNLFILPFRSKKSAAAYRKIWTGRGSPLLFYLKDLKAQVSSLLGEEYVVEIGMRYGSPSMGLGLAKLIGQGVTSIDILPLYPQYSFSTTGSTVNQLQKISADHPDWPPIRILPPFYNHPGYIDALSQLIRDKTCSPDHVLFSFHGLPKKQIQKGDPYQSQCIWTAKTLARKLGLSSDLYSIVFQSRLGWNSWIQPFTDQEIVRLAQSGKKRLTIVMPSFIADCLETLEEIGIRAKETALAHGVESFNIVPCLNTHPLWIKAVCQMVRSS